jgi:hypothetical protein
LAWAALAVTLSPVLAQTAPDANPPETDIRPAAPQSSSLPPAAASEILDGPRQGDRWTYELKDNVTDEVKATITNTVVDVTDKEIVTRASFRGQSNQQTVIFDHNWNRVDDMVWKWTPNDGLGIKTPLAVGKEWRHESTSSNMTNGTILRTAVDAKVVGKESVTTKAGTFDVFKVVYTVRQTNTHDSTKSSNSTVDLLYAPLVNHWVKRRAVVRVEGRLRDDTTLELVDYSRKP